MVIILFTRIWNALIGIILVPIYIRLIGVESYGLVAFYTTLAGTLVILDVGLSASITRQVAILNTEKDKAKDLNDLVFTVEVINWIIAICVGLLIVLFSGLIATHWVSAKSLSVASIKQSIILMGVIFAVQFPSSVYEGAMVGLQKQTTSAILIFFYSTVKAIGAIAILKFVAPTIESYFIWQAVTTLLLTFSMRIYVRRKIAREKPKAVFSIVQLKTIWRFAAGITGIALVSFFITQIDKIVVSRNLVQLSYYSLAFLLAGGITAVVSPMQSIIYPKLTQTVATNNNRGLIELFHKYCKWVSIIVFPLGLVLIFFANEILILWTKNITLTNETAPILQVVVAGTLFNCMMIVPYFITLAKGNTKYGLYQNIIAAIVLVPLLFWFFSKYGALGAAMAWLIVNAGIIIISIPVFHNIYFKNEIWNWFKNDVFVPLLVGGVLALSAKYFQKHFINNLTIISFSLIMAFISVCYLLIITETRDYFKNIILTFKKSGQ